MGNLKLKENALLPYEKCIRYGCEFLSDAELLAVIIRTGTREKNCLQLAEELLEYSGDMGLLGLKHLEIEDYKSIKGIGTVKAVMLKCISELSLRISRRTMNKRSKFHNSDDVAAYCMEELRHLENECFYMLLLNTKCELINETKLSYGTVNNTCVSEREVFRYALLHGAVYIIVVHNHPSGDPTPSGEDILTTQRLVDAGKTVGIPVLDHIIIGDNVYISLKEKNMM